MAIFLTADSKVIVQGITGSEGTKHTRRMVASGTNVVGGVNPRKAGTQVDVDGTSVPVFGGITSCDAVANGIVQALGMLGDAATKPLVVRLDGNNVEEGRRILSQAAHPLVTVVDTMDGAADKAAELAGSAS